jgi:hypothetical protein
MSKQLVLRGTRALKIRVPDDGTVAADVGGVTHLRHLDVSGDAVITDELHSHDGCSSVFEVPHRSRFTINTWETGTLFVLPAESELLLSTPPSVKVPLHFELVGVDLVHFRLSSDTFFAPSSVVLCTDKDGRCRLRRPSTLDGRCFDCVDGQLQNVRLTVRTVVLPGGEAAAYRLTGTVSTRDP